MRKIFFLFALLGVFAGIALTIKNIKFSNPPKKVEEFSGVTIACLGDSITRGTNNKFPAFPTLLEDSLDGSRVYNYGISWSTIATMDSCHCHPEGNYTHYPFVNRYENMHSSDIILVFGGVNDYGCLIPLGTPSDTTTSTFYGACNELAKGLKKTYPDSYIVFLTGFNYWGDKATNDAGVYWRDYNDAIVNTCKKYNIDCLDLYNNLEFNTAEDTVDGIHPSEEFVTNMLVPTIVGFLEKNYKPR